MAFRDNVFDASPHLKWFIEMINGNIFPEMEFLAVSEIPLVVGVCLVPPGIF